MRATNVGAIHLIVRNIVRVREERGMTQDDLAACAGLQRTNLAMIESGASGVTISVLYAIAEALCVEARELLPLVADTKSLCEVTVAGRKFVLSATEIEQLRQQLAEGEA